MAKKQLANIIYDEDNFHKVTDWFIDRNAWPLVEPTASSRKLKAQTRMISIIKKSLAVSQPLCFNENKELDKFVKACNNAKGLTEKKRVYMSDYGYENVKEYLNLETDELRKKDNWERYSMQGVVQWWKNKASKRYESLKADGRLRTQLETWNCADDIDIIR